MLSSDAARDLTMVDGTISQSSGNILLHEGYNGRYIELHHGLNGQTVSRLMVNENFVYAHIDDSPDYSLSYEQT
ncbi:hypothetical protein, partial [Skermanella stibiiresistens]|uniref:hypothetical protein n=1 Tax=Skermanella stibiiresistens TaxID=913326 RepID=UPI001B3BCDFC